MINGPGLGGAYDATIGRIKARAGERARLGVAALMWILHSERPLNVDEICHALAVEIGSAAININNVPSIRTVLGCCQGLAAVDNGSSTVRLIHFTLKEYLSGQIKYRPNCCGSQSTSSFLLDTLDLLSHFLSHFLPFTVFPILALPKLQLI